MLCARIVSQQHEMPSATTTQYAPAPPASSLRAHHPLNGGSALPHQLGQAPGPATEPTVGSRGAAPAKHGQGTLVGDTRVEQGVVAFTSRGFGDRPVSYPEHLRILLDDEEDAPPLAQLQWSGLGGSAGGLGPPTQDSGGRLVAFRKPNGALVVSDVFRRLVGRVLAKHAASEFRERGTMLRAQSAPPLRWAVLLVRAKAADGIYIVSPHERIRDLSDALSVALWDRPKSSRVGQHATLSYLEIDPVKEVAASVERLRAKLHEVMTAILTSSPLTKKVIQAKTRPSVGLRLVDQNWHSPVHRFLERRRAYADLAVTAQAQLRFFPVVFVTPSPHHAELEVFVYSHACVDSLSGTYFGVHSVARTLAQQYSRHIDEATSPHQFALSTRAGAEALAHSLQLETDTDSSCTVLSVDGIGAFEIVSRHAMLSELPKGEGGEQGDPLMPALFALALAPAPRSFQEELHPGEHVRGPFSRPPLGLVTPPCPHKTVVCVSFAAPLGTDEYVAAQLQHLSVQHRALLQLLPGIHDLQVSWLLLLFSASPRVHYCLRLLPPALTAVFAAEHDRDILCCLAQLLHIVPGTADPLPQSAAARANLSLRYGGLGLRSAAEHAPAAYFASWADSLGAP
ncbi:unnamed protein product [Symbiodinium sp. KB8]|nr:unnamed protein product [Symbiodinium sp. KB8]